MLLSASLHLHVRLRSLADADLPDDLFLNNSGASLAVYKKAKAEVERYLSKSQAASTAARTPTRLGGSARSDAGSSAGRKRGAEEQLTPTDRSPAALLAKAAAVQSGSAFGKHSPATPSSVAARRKAGQTSSPVTPRCERPARAADKPRSEVRFDTTHQGPSTPTSNPATPSKGKGKAVAAAALQHTPTTSSRLASRVITQEESSSADEQEAQAGSAEEEEEEEQLEVRPSKKRTGRRYRFLLFAQAGQAPSDSEDEEAHRPGAEQRRIEYEAKKLALWKERNAELLTPEAALRGEWDEDGWGRIIRK